MVWSRNANVKAAQRRTHSKTLRAYRGPSDVAKGHGVRWLAGNGADTAFEREQTFNVGSWMLKVRCFPHSQSGVCPHPSPTAVQDAGARGCALTLAAILCQLRQLL